jgi:hypothetical protein
MWSVSDGVHVGVLDVDGKRDPGRSIDAHTTAHRSAEVTDTGRVLLPDGRPLRAAAEAAGVLLAGSLPLDHETRRALPSRAALVVDDAPEQDRLVRREVREDLGVPRAVGDEAFRRDRAVQILQLAVAVMRL